MVQRFQRFSRTIGVLMCASGLAALMGWWWGLPRLTMVLLGHLPMTVNAAIGLILSGASLLLSRTSVEWRVPAGAALSLMVLGIGGVTLIEYVFAVDLGVNRGFGRLASLSPWRTTELVSAAMVLLGGLGLLASLRRCLWLREALALVLLAIAMLGLAAHGIVLAGTDNSLLGQVPVQTALMLLLSTLGWLAGAPTVGMTRVTTATTLGGTFARRLLLPALLLPVMFTYVFQQLQSWLDLPDVLTFSLMAVFSGGAVAWLIWWVALLLDKLERQRRETAQLRTDADTDALTGLANRRAFDDTLNRLLQEQNEHGVGFSLVMLDLDKFKDYNDDFGHLGGDDVLRIIGGLLGAGVRPLDLAARYGGEEFALLLPAMDATRAADVAQRVLEKFHAFAWPQRAVSVSIGVAQSALDDDAAALIERA
ncbi:MAG: GGDEF domain-containing protein, partial [Rhodanobacter sp.]